MQIIFDSLGELQNFVTEMGWTRPESEQAQPARLRRRAGSETAKADTNAGQREAVAPSPASPAPTPVPVAQPAQPAPVAQQAPAPAAPVGEITDDQLRQAVLNLGHGSGIATAKAILQEFGIKRAPQCPPERRGELLSRLQAAKA